MSFRAEGKNELISLRNQLDSNDPAQRKIAAKRVVAMMRAGENLSILFSSMLRCVKTNDIELKKLTYHYLVTYATSEPEQSIMAVNTFIQDSQDFNPLIRALAVRTMCRIKIDTVAENMILPLKQTLADKDPYVRKTAALAVAKLYEVIPEQVETAQIFPILMKLLSDENPLVVSNTTIALFEINEHRTTPLFVLNEKTVSPLIAALTQCSEWVQTNLLDCLSKYKPLEAKEADFLIDRLIPFLKHSNPSVSIGAFRCIFMFMNKSKKPEQEIFSNIIPPFITMCSSGEPEIQFIVLRTISLFVNKYPKALSKEIRVFFIKYNDPSYIKMEKLNILIQIVSPKNITLLLDELDEYCNSVDIGFVTKSIEILGQLATKIEASARRVVDILVRQVESKNDFACEQAIIVITDILRRFPGEFESVITVVFKNIENIKNSRAKASAIWILGEYCQRIDNASDILDMFIDSFHDESPEVQIELLTALVKVYCLKPDESKDQLQFVLNESIKESVLPDVRNRALIYWRLLSADPEAAKKIIVFPKHLTGQNSSKFTPQVLDELIKNIGNVSGVLHVAPVDFIRRVRYMPEDNDEEVENYDVSWDLAKSQENLNVFVSWQSQKFFLKVVNKSQEKISNFALALNKNPIGINLDQDVKFPTELQYGESFEVQIPIKVLPETAANFEQTDLQFALRTNSGLVMFTSPINIYAVCKRVDGVNKQSFESSWTMAPGEDAISIKGTMADNVYLESKNISVVSNENNVIMCVLNFGNCTYLVKMRQSGEDVQILVRGQNNLFPIIRNNAQSLFLLQ